MQETVYSVTTTAGNININGNLDPTEIDLSAAGNIANTSNTLTADIVNLSSTGGGNIGTALNPILTAADQTLSVNTSGSGSADVINTGRGNAEHLSRRRNLPVTK